MIADVIDTFRKTTPVVNQKFVRKKPTSDKYLSPSYTEKGDVSTMSSNIAILPCLRSFHQKREKVKYLRKRGHFDHLNHITRFLEDVRKSKV